MAEMAAQQPQASASSISDYDVGRFLGAGSYARVYQAYSKVLNRDVALKIVDKKKMIEAGKVPCDG